MPTPHIEASIDEIAKVVLMPGDPLRAEYLAKTYLTDYKLVNKVRNMYAYTGFYKGVRVTVMASGMGMPSIGIYSYELFTEYNVDVIIRIGSAGAYDDNLNLYDIVLAESAYSESTYAKVLGLTHFDTINATKEINDLIINVAKDNNIDVKLLKIHSSDVFYSKVFDYKEALKNYNVKAVEMESFALFANALATNKKAACLLTISDTFGKNEKISSSDRQKKFNSMMELALESAIKYQK